MLFELLLSWQTNNQRSGPAYSAQEKTLRAFYTWHVCGGSSLEIVPVAPYSVGLVSHST